MNTALAAKKYIPALTSIRAIAAFMVFLHHYNFIPTFDSRLFELFLFQGYAGVSLFFTLSGFLIHRNYIHKFADFKLGLLKSYFVNRFARVYPMYLILSVAALLLLQVKSPYYWFLNLSLIKGFSDAYKFQLISTTWSLTVEECFYFLFPLLIFFRFKKIPYIIILFAIYLSGYGLYELGNYLQYEFFMYPDKFVIIYTFFGRVFEFLLGMMCSELLTKDKIKLFNKPIYTYSGVALSLFAFAALTYIASIDVTAKTPNKIVAMFYDEGLLVHHFILPIGFTLCILGLATESSLLQKIMSTKIFELLGKSSYVFYLLQGVMFNIFLYKLWPDPDNISIFITMTLASVALFVFVEDPLNKVIRGQGTAFEELKKLKYIF